MDDSQLIVTCTNCGSRICKAKPGTAIEIACPKCKGGIILVVDIEHRVIIQLIQPATA